MGKVVLDMAMPLDGFVSAPNDEDGGLHNYFFSPSDVTAKVIEEGITTTGAIIMGRCAYDLGDKFDGFVDTPYKVPHLVLTHRVPAKAAKGETAFTFVTDGIESAIEKGRVAAEDKDVVVGGGANIAQQYLRAGLLDEIQIHLIPILLSSGIRLFDHTAPIELESTRVIESTGVTHLKFRVVK